MEEFVTQGFDEVEDSIKKIIEKTHMFVIPSTWQKIGYGAFNSIQDLKMVKIGENVKELGNMSFLNCSRLEEVSLPNCIKTIPPSAFNTCRSLSKINMPKHLECIDAQAFDSCDSLEYLALPEGLKRINMFAFCSSGLNFIDLPESLTHIGEGAFCSCGKLEEITIPNKVEYLGEETFYNCFSLQKVVLGEKLTSIGERCFSHCNELEEVSLPDEIKEIAAGAFGACYKLNYINLPNSLKTIENHVFAQSGLKSISLPENLTTLGNGAFGECSKLKTVHFNEKLTYIPPFCFMSCYDLNEIVIPANIKVIDNSAFIKCKNLKQVTISEGVEKIEKLAFGGCAKLTQIKLPKSVKYVGENAFNSCNKLDEITIPKGCDFKAKLPFNPAFITYSAGEFVITKHKRKNAYKCTEDVLGLTLLNFDNKQNLYAQMEDKQVRELYEAMFTNLPLCHFDDFMKTKNLKFYKRLYEACGFNKVSKEQQADLYKFLYNIGAFKGKTETEVTTKSGTKLTEVFPAQKVCEFLINGKFKFDTICITKPFNTMESQGYKHEFTEFILSGNNFEKMLEINSEMENFFANCYNEFEEVQKTNTSNKGSQRRLKPSIEKFVSYFKTNKFKGVNHETQKLAEVLSPYFSSQRTFDRAKDILTEFNNLGISNSLVELDKYGVIDSCAEKIAALTKEALKNIKDVAEVINYEWLKKNDERIFILGKDCDCCAHAEGQGFGIMRAGVIHPDVQTLVIKDGNNIVAKATLYLNREKGYAVINTISVKSEYKKYSSLIYKKLEEGVRRFAEGYNQANNSELKVVTVGMNLNGVEKEIRKKAKKSDTIYESLNYGMYGVSGARYRGDSDDEQFVLWEEQNGRER